MTLSTEQPAASARRSRPRWWRRPWVAPLVVVAVSFVAFSLPPYLSLDPGRSRVPAPGWFPPHFAIVSLHVVFGSIAMITCCLQVWPWFRERHPAAHRRLGRLYVFAGCLPAGLLALVAAVTTPDFGLVAAAGGVVLAPLWLGCTLAGWRMARRHRFADHRRWMIRSFAMTMSIVTNRLWAAVFIVTLSPSFEGDVTGLTTTVAGLSAWLGWVLPLLLAEWWLERGDAARRRRRAAVTRP
ncbi:MAG TPA: DUF2306 domain-containing protein [Nonomuraea sp.]|nr:DUF2306 domain-containing protein [Nonomuraea sp.]